jgi:hypothetical protein
LLAVWIALSSVLTLTVGVADPPDVEELHPTTAE